VGWQTTMDEAAATQTLDLTQASTPSSPLAPTSNDLYDLAVCVVVPTDFGGGGNSQPTRPAAVARQRRRYLGVPERDGVLGGGPDVEGRHEEEPVDASRRLDLLADSKFLVHRSSFIVHRSSFIVQRVSCVSRVAWQVRNGCG